MKKFIIYRHGEYDDRQELTAQSAQEIFARTLLIKQHIGCAGTVFTSPVCRAEQTARVISLAMDNARIETEALLAEHMSDYPHEGRDRLIKLAGGQKCDIIAVVSHRPNISRMFMVGLNPGMEIIFEAESWGEIFENLGGNLIARSQTAPDAFLLQRYFNPVCSEEELQQLRRLDFLAPQL